MTTYVETEILPKTSSLSDAIITRRAGGLSDRDGTHCSIVPLWYFSSGSTQRATEKQSHVSQADDKPWKPAEMKTTFNYVSVFSSNSDLSLMVALAPEATNALPSVDSQVFIVNV